MSKRITAIQSAALVAAALASMTLGGRAEGRTVGIHCGANINSIVRVENSASNTNSPVFVAIAGATATFNVPTGQTRCVKVLFTGKATCAGFSSVQDTCYIRAILDGVEMHPQGGGTQTFVSESTTARAHAYLWVTRIGAGNHTVRIERRVLNSPTTFALDDWTLDVSIYQ